MVFQRAVDVLGELEEQYFVTYAVGDEQNANRELVVIPFHTQISFEAVKATIADVD
jgi:hypothetical protein